MKIRIDHKGILGIERGCVIKEQICPFDGLNRCGDFCPLFGEPTDESGNGDGVDTIRICQGRVLTGEIVDEREGKK